MYRVYFFLSLVYLAQAQIPSFGFCPDYLPMAYFDMGRFLGKWYEAERYFQFSEVASRCVVTDYAVGPNGKIYVSNEVTNRFTGVRRVIGGNLDLTGKKTEGRLVVKYDTQPISTTSALTILDTDYDTYAVIWSCSGLGPVNAQSAWLMTRERIPDAITLQTAYGVLDRYKISRTFFVKTDQEGCAIAASDLNAALGIASSSTDVDQNADTDNGKNVKESIGVKAQPVPEVLLKRNEEEKSANQERVAVKSAVEHIKPADAVQESSDVETETEKNEAVKTSSVADELVNDQEKFHKSLGKTVTVNKDSETVFDSVRDATPNKDISDESDVQREEFPDNEKKNCPDTTTTKDVEAIGEDNLSAKN